MIEYSLTVAFDCLRRGRQLAGSCGRNQHLLQSPQHQTRRLHLLIPRSSRIGTVTLRLHPRPSGLNSPACLEKTAPAQCRGRFHARNPCLLRLSTAWPSYRPRQAWLPAWLPPWASSNPDPALMNDSVDNSARGSRNRSPNDPPRWRRRAVRGASSCLRP